MSLLIPIEIILHVMRFTDPRTLLNISITCKNLKRELEVNFLKYFKIYSRKYPRIFKQPSPCFTIFNNNCLLAYLEEIGINFFKINFIDKELSLGYYKNVKKMITLKIAGFSDYESQKIARSNRDISKILFLKKKGFDDGYARMGNELNQLQLKNIVLLKESNFMQHYCFNIVKIFKDVSKLIYLKNHGFWDSYCIEIAQKFSSFDDLIMLKNNNFEGAYCIKIKEQLEDFQKIIMLKNEGMEDSYCLEAALYFDDITTVLKFKKIGIRDYYCIYYAKYINEEDIPKICNLKNQGHCDIVICDILKIEIF